MNALTPRPSDLTVDDEVWAFSVAGHEPPRTALPGTLVFWGSDVGEGKTYDIIDRVVRTFFADPDNATSELVAPTNRLCREIIGRLQREYSLRREQQQRHDLPERFPIELWLGFGQKNPKTGKPFCIQLDQVKQQQDAGHDPYDGTCRLVEDGEIVAKCEAYDTCPIARLRETKSNHWIGPTAMLKHARKGKAASKRPADLVEIDEGWVETVTPLAKEPPAIFRQALGKYEVKAAHLVYRANAGMTEAEAVEVVGIAHKLSRELTHMCSEPWQRARITHLPPLGDLQRLRRALYAVLRLPLGYTPHMSESALQALDKNQQRAARIKDALHLLDGIIQSVLAGPDLPGLWSVQYERRDPTEVECCVLALPTKGYDAPKVSTSSATDPPGLYASLFGGGVITFKTPSPPRPHATFVRVKGGSTNGSLYGKTSGGNLGHSGWQGWNMALDLSRRHRGQGWQPDEVIGPKKDVLVVGTKEYVRRVKTLAKRGKTTIPDNIALEHFGAVEGLDQYRHVAAVLIVGRHMPPLETLLMRAERLAGERIELQGVVDDTVRIEEKYKDGTSSILTSNYGHSHPVMDALIKAKVHGSVLQANRAREQWRDPDNPVTIYFLNDLHLPRYSFARMERIETHDGWYQELATLGVVPVIGLDGKTRPGLDQLISAMLPDRYKSAAVVKTIRARRRESGEELADLATAHGFTRPIPMTVLIRLGQTRRRHWFWVNAKSKAAAKKMLTEMFPDAHEVRGGIPSRWNDTITIPKGDSYDQRD